MDHLETHVSNLFQGTMTHMAPEIMLDGRVSKAADVYGE
jgi:serine/threonine protein kinase